MQRWEHHARRQVLLAAAGGAALGALLSYPMAHLLNIRSTGGLIETFAEGGLWAVLCFERALLQARTAYPAYAANLLIEGVLRCAVTLVAVAAGLGVPGAAAGFADQPSGGNPPGARRAAAAGSSPSARSPSSGR